jgi:catechol 2,3-dioxygenase-like lactoylglutathione lyase family enzyme
MKKGLLSLTILMAACATGFYLNTLLAHIPFADKREMQTEVKQNHMKLGAFSVSLSVQDLQKSRAFYEKLGFTAFAGSMEQNYLIMKNEQTLIGLFQGMFQGNILTFNPGWDAQAQNLEEFDDIRTIQKVLKNSGLTLSSEADENTTGPASLMLADPDGNMILLDQHR